jgi:5-methylcytosine-specific restriction endonuclease McrA
VPTRTGSSLIDRNRWAWSALRRTILQRDRWTCQVCGAPADSVDHIIPRARGGTDDPSNLRACCARDQNPDARPVVTPFPTPSASRDIRDDTIIAKITPILGELTLGGRRDP